MNSNVFEFLTQEIGYDMSHYIGVHLIEMIRKDSTRIMDNLKKSICDVHDKQTIVLQYIRPHLEYQVTQYILYTSPDANSNRRMIFNLYDNIKTENDPSECNKLFINFKYACDEFVDLITKQYEDICVLVSNDAPFFAYDID